VEQAADGPSGLEAARTVEPDVITLDVMMPGMDGWAVLTELKADDALSEIPIIMLTIMDEKDLGFSLGASEYITKPIDRARLAGILQKYAGDRREKEVLLVEDDATARSMMKRVLEKEGWTVTEAENGRVALECLDESVPALVLLDLMMPEMDGFEFIEALRRSEENRDIPVVVITAKELTESDRSRLNGEVERIVQKRHHSRDELLNEVRSLVTAHAPRVEGGASN
jgi:CheY-like chemotaxis protein